MTAQDLAHRVAVEGRRPGEAFEQHDPERVEVRPVVDRRGDEPGRLGREITHRRRVLVRGPSTLPPPRDSAEIDELRRDALSRSARR